MRSHAAVHLAVDEHGQVVPPPPGHHHFEFGDGQDGQRAKKRFSDMYSGVRKLEIEHGAEENAKRDHDEIRDRSLRRRGRGTGKVIVSFHGLRK